MASIRVSYGTDRLSTNRQLSVEISDLHAGAISEIISTRLSKLVTAPSDLNGFYPGLVRDRPPFNQSTTQRRNLGSSCWRHIRNHLHSIIKARNGAFRSKWLLSGSRTGQTAFQPIDNSASKSRIFMLAPYPKSSPLDYQSS